MILQKTNSAVAILAMMGLFGCPAGELDWECHADKPCPNGQLCVPPQDLPDGSTDPATDPACYTVCSSSARCPGGNRACLGELCVLFDDDCSKKECPEGFFCNTAAHCEKYPSTADCDNFVRDGSESDVDCGGSCTPCADGRRCNSGGDCQSGVCDSAGSCAVPTCDDGVANGGEVGVDCSGVCAALCPAGEPCRDAGDCESGICRDDSVCEESACDDGKLNGGETAVDCGGPCAGCPDGYPCNVPDDCESRACSATGECLAPSCTDRTENGDETDVDCGGPCEKCEAGLKCKVAADCDSGVCDAGTCRLLLSLGSAGFDEAGSVAVSPSGSILVLGSGDGLNLGGESIPPGTFLASVLPTGEVEWPTRLPAYAKDLAVDGSGNIVVAGKASGIYVGSFSPEGSKQWDKAFECVDSGGVANDVAVDSNGNILVAGEFGGEVSFGGDCLTLISAGWKNAFVAKFSSTGSCRWAKSYGNGEAVSISRGVTSMAADNSVVVTGSFDSSMDLGDGMQTSAGLEDVFIVALSSSGEHVWSKRFGDTGRDYGRTVADASNGVVLIGDFDSSHDLFVTKLGLNDGSDLWSRSFGSAGTDGKAEVDADNNITFTGWFSSTINFGSSTLMSAGAADIFVTKLSPDGEPIGSQRFGGPDQDFGRAVALDSRGRAVVIGDFDDTVEFGGSALTSAGNRDICVFTVVP